MEKCFIFVFAGCNTPPPYELFDVKDDEKNNPDVHSHTD